MLDVSSLRRSYNLSGLDESELTPDPMTLFERWLKDAIDAPLYDPNGVVVSTVDEQQQPYSRMVLLKDYDATSLVFYTNLGSRKAEQIKHNPKICMYFPWFYLERQVMFLGTAKRLTVAEDLAYFRKRPRGSQLGAWASHQSKLISARGVLESKFLEVKERFKNGEVPLPSFWGGFRLTFHTVEFWQGRENRLHDRFIYLKNEQGQWESPKRLSP
ncbi:MAG: pyridoxamine 5'-phosphate oxidase [Succinivibrio sp.]|nr:pyridoxamine 5'-phosphate oxidase [Succinivibrio sp.]